PSLADDVPTTTADPASHQHLVTYGIAFGLTGELTPGVDDPTDPGFEWPTPVEAEKTTIDDLWHATYNSRGEFLSAGDSGALKTALEDMLLRITNRGSGSASSASVSTSQISSDSKVYRAHFESDGWQGTINSYNLTETNNVWTLTKDLSAADKLADNNSRVILTNNAGGVEFKNTNLTGDMKADLNTGPDGTPDGRFEDRLAYIRGDHSNEGVGNDDFRQRATMGNGKTSRLGDIIHSSATFVGAPNVGWPDAAPFPTGNNAYSKFVAS
ncbi:MAG: hypothetical protein GY942_23840, partial [Aestuariibacter sp.]|nr:hypothetical protein [Aestuariibacter sp.]